MKYSAPSIIFLDWILLIAYIYACYLCLLNLKVRKFWLVEILTVITLKTYLRLWAALLYLKTKDVNVYPEILLPDLKYVCPAMLYSMLISTPISLAEKWLKYISKISKWLWVCSSSVNYDRSCGIKDQYLLSKRRSMFRSGLLKSVIDDILQFRQTHTLLCNDKSFQVKVRWCVSTHISVVNTWIGFVLKCAPCLKWTCVANISSHVDIFNILLAQ